MIGSLAPLQAAILRAFSVFFLFSCNLSHAIAFMKHGHNIHLYVHHMILSVVLSRNLGLSSVACRQSQANSDLPYCIEETVIPVAHAS